MRIRNGTGAPGRSGGISQAAYGSRACCSISCRAGTGFSRIGVPRIPERDRAQGCDEVAGQGPLAHLLLPVEKPFGGLVQGDRDAVQRGASGDLGSGRAAGARKVDSVEQVAKNTLHVVRR